MPSTPFSPWPCFTDEEINAVAEMLRSNHVNYWTGDKCRLFESEFADWVGTTHAIALMNGTVALDLALKGFGIVSGDEVIVTPRSFVASASCVVNAGARPVFADVDRDSGNISADTIRHVLTERTRAVVVVHLGGYPVDMDPIMDLARPRGIKVIEDCAQAHGARYKGRSVGSLGDIGTWSFCQDKVMTTGGEGGMVTTNDEQLWNAMWSYKDHGKSWDAVYNRAHLGGFRWLHESFGTNWRMLEMQAVLGRIQLQRMSGWTAARNRNARRIHDSLAPFASSGGPIRVPAFVTSESGTDVHAYYRYYCYVRPENLALGWDRDRIATEITGLGVPCFQGSCSEIYREQAFEKSGLAPLQRLPAAMELGETSIAFLAHPTLTAGEIGRTADAITTVLKDAALRA